jgi:hypothetical protein
MGEHAVVPVHPGGVLDIDRRLVRGVDLGGPATMEGGVMTPAELIAACDHVIENGGNMLVLCLPGRSSLLNIRGGPRGELVCVNAVGDHVVRFKAKAVKAYLEKHFGKIGQ